MRRHLDESEQVEGWWGWRCSVETQLSHMRRHLNENEQDGEDEDVLLMKENQGECILGISGGCGGNIRRIWCWISSDGWYVGYRVTDDSHYLSKGMEPLSPSISWASDKHFPLCKGGMIQNSFFLLKIPRRNVGHKLSAAVSEDLNWVFPSLLVKLIKISHSPPISSPLTVQLFKILEIDPKFQASYNLQTPLANSNLFLTNSSLSDWNGGSAGRPIDQTWIKWFWWWRSFHSKFKCWCHDLKKWYFVISILHKVQIVMIFLSFPINSKSEYYHVFTFAAILASLQTGLCVDSPAWALRF